MRTSWSAFHLHLLALCHRRSAELLFAGMRARQPILDGLCSIDALLDRQHDTTDPSVSRDAVVRALVVEAQEVGPYSDLATTILILALWPGLDAVRHRLWRDWPNVRDDLSDTILGQVVIAIRRLQLASVRRVAATLVMNTERDTRRALLVQKMQQRNELPIHDSPEALAELVRGDEAMNVETLRAHLLPLLGRDTWLFLRIVILGETQAEAGRALGLSHEAARKRHQRAMAKLATLQV